jgi:hypothetical protein
MLESECKHKYNIVLQGNLSMDISVKLFEYFYVTESNHIDEEIVSSIINLCNNK